MKNPVSIVAGIILITGILFPILSYTIIFKFYLSLNEWKAFFVGIGSIMLIFSEDTKFSIKMKIIGFLFALIGFLGFFLDNFVFFQVPVELTDCTIEVGLILFIIGIVAEIWDLIVTFTLMFPENSNPVQPKIQLIQNQIKTDAEKQDNTSQKESFNEESTNTISDPEDENESNPDQEHGQDWCTLLCLLSIGIVVIAFMFFR